MDVLELYPLDFLLMKHFGLCASALDISQGALRGFWIESRGISFNRSFFCIVLNAAILFAIIQRIVKKRNFQASLLSGFLALFWATSPLRVEPVACAYWDALLDKHECSSDWNFSLFWGAKKRCF